MPEASAPSGAPAGSPGTPAPGQQPAAKPAGGESPAQAEARRLKLRIDGQEKEYDESEVVAKFKRGENVQKLLSEVDKRRAEALKRAAEADGILGKLKDKGNLRNVLRELGYTADDLRKTSEEVILDAIEEEKLSPAEKRARELEQKLKAHEDEKAKAEEEKKQAAFKEEVARHRDELAGLFLQTFEGLGLPKSSARFVLGRMAALYAQNEEANLESTPEEMAAYVLEGMRGEHRGMLSGLKGQALVEHLGPDVVKEVLSHHLAQARAKRGMGATPALETPAPKPAAQLNPRKGRWAEIEKLLK